MSRFKVIVIGSGAGGAPVAAALAARWGEGVAIVEAGKHYTAKDFNQLEAEMVPKLYAQAGVQGTEDGVLSVLQGQCVGGSTVINDAICFEPPPEIEERWKAYGVDIQLDGLRPYIDEVLTALQATTIPKVMHNRANYLLGLGAARMGWAGERMMHNSAGCVQCGFRHLGCAYNAKQSMNVSFIPRALAAGAKLFDEEPVHHLEKVSGGWRVHTAKQVLEAETVVVCAGVVQTPAILLRSGIDAGHGLQFHVQSVAWGDFEDPVDMHNGIPMSYGVMEFADVFGHTGPGYVIEGVAVQPLAFSVQPQLDGVAHEAVMKRYRHLSGSLCLVRSKARGQVSLAGERARIDYPIIAEDTARIAHFYDRATELYMAAGAQRVLLSHRHVNWVTEVTPLPTMDAGTFYVYTAHPFGGANRGTTTDAVGRVKGQEGLWVLDGSAFPEALGVNPQVTIAALALEGAARILG